VVMVYHTGGGGYLNAAVLVLPPVFTSGHWFWGQPTFLSSPTGRGAVESRIGPTGDFEVTPGELLTLNKPNCYPKSETTPARKLVSNQIAETQSVDSTGGTHYQLKPGC